MNDPKPIFKLSATQLERFWKRVDKSGSCWLWMGKPNRDGYGDVKFSNEIFRAHRVAYTVAIGDIPPKLVIDHLCRVRMCVNPAHLEPVTSQENTARGQGQGRPKIKPGEERTHCKKGHALKGENIMWTKSGYRFCRTCNRDYMRQYMRNRDRRKQAA